MLKRIVTYLLITIFIYNSVFQLINFRLFIRSISLTDANSLLINFQKIYLNKTIQRAGCNTVCANDCTQTYNQNEFFKCLESCDCEYIDENSSSNIFSSLTLSFLCILFSYLLNKEHTNSPSLLSYFTLSNKIDDIDKENTNDITSAESYDEPLINKQ